MTQEKKTNNRVHIKLDFINETHCKAYAMRIAKEQRPEWNPDRVSRDEFLIDLNAKVRQLIYGSIKKHPTKGKTIRFLF